MKKWKLFDSKAHGQILVARVENKDGVPKIEISIEIEGFDVISIGPVFKGDDGESARDVIFDSFEIEQAEKSIDGLMQELKDKGIIE